MTIVNVSNLTGAALDWAVAKCEYDDLAALNIQYPERAKHYPKVSPSTNWSQGGPIIDREDITWSMNMDPEHGPMTRYRAFSYRFGSDKSIDGPTKLIAAMRCYCCSKLGDEVDVPEVLL